MLRDKIAVAIGSALIWILMMAGIPGVVDAATYYVSSIGSDASDGLTPDSAWQTISKVNAADLQPGDSVLFRRGDVWRQMLQPATSGTAGNPITFGAYGTGTRPRFSGTTPALPQRNAIRNASFEQFTGTPDDGVADQIGHFITSGGIVEIVTEVPSGSRYAAKLQKVGSIAHLTLQVYLPADSQVTLNWHARSMNTDGSVAIRHQLEGPDFRYLQNDFQTWSPAEQWNVYPLTGAVDGPWTGRSLTFRTDGKPGAYQVYFLSGNSAAATDTSFVANLNLLFDWQPYNAHTYRIACGYDPRRVIIQSSDDWMTAIKASLFNRTKDNLFNGEWVYDDQTGYLYLRDDSGDGQKPAAAVEISFPRTESSLKSGVFVDNNHLIFDSLAVTAWPFANPAYEDVSGISVTADAIDVSITNCLVAHNFRIGIGASNKGGSFANNVIAYNGGSGLLLQDGAEGITIKSNEVMYNGYWGLSGDDGEGIALGEGTSGNLIEWNDVHHNNRNPWSWNHGALILHRSRDNIVRFNTVHDNYKAGVVIDGANNQFYYNVVFNSGIGFPDTDAWGLCNLQLRDDTLNGGGGNRIYNNVFFGGSADYRWMGNLFVKNSCTDTHIQNNVFWGYVNHGSDNVQIRVDTGTNMTGTVISNNLIGPENSGFIHYLGTNYNSLSDFQTATGLGGASLNMPPKFSNPETGNFHPLTTSPLIDAGVPVGLSVDIGGIPVGDPPNMGSFESSEANAIPQLLTVGDKTVPAEQTLLFYVRATDENAERLTFTAEAGGGYDLVTLGAEFAEVLFGDLNDDTNVDNADLHLLLGAYSSRKGDIRYDPKLDLNGSGNIDYDDFLLLRPLLGSTVQDEPNAGRFRWTPAANQASLSVPLTLTVTDSQGASTDTSVSISVTDSLTSNCTADVNEDGSINYSDLIVQKSVRQQDFHGWVLNCWSSQLTCGDVDGNGVVDDQDQLNHSRRTWQELNRWVRECWQPAQ